MPDCIDNHWKYQSCTATVSVMFLEIKSHFHQVEDIKLKENDLSPSKPAFVSKDKA